VQYELKPDVDYRLEFVTNKGTFDVDLYEEEAPRAAANILGLAYDNFYDDTSFYRVVKGYLIQGGDPRGDGSGGPGYTLQEDWNPTLSFKPYTLGMDLSVNGSQFFILSGAYVDDGALDQKYSVVGIVTDGTEVIDAIENAQVGIEIDGVKYPEMPVQPIIVRNVIIRTERK